MPETFSIDDAWFEGNVIPIARWSAFRMIINMANSEEEIPYNLFKSQRPYRARKPDKIVTKTWVGHLVRSFGGRMDTDVEPVFTDYVKLRNRRIASFDYDYVSDRVEQPDKDEFVKQCVKMDTPYFNIKKRKYLTNAFVTHKLRDLGIGVEP